MTKQLYQIVQHDPIYCPIFGGIRGGSHAKVLPMTYFSAALALKLANRMTEEDYQYGGETHFDVIKFGANPHRDRYVVTRESMGLDAYPKFEYDMPF